MPYLNRTLCDVLDEMRKIDITKNYSYLLGLIEEAQSMGNRMETKLNDGKDYEHLREKSKKLEAEIQELKKQKAELGGEEKEDGLFS